MKSSILLPAIALLALLGTSAQAATVSITVSTAGAGNPLYVDSLGNFLGAGDVVRVGIFDTSTLANLTTLETSDDYAAINALFTPLAEGGSNSGTVTETGATGTDLVINNLFGTGNIFGQIQGIDSNFCTPGTELAVWVFNNSDPLQATQWGIFTTTSGWEFPAALGSQTLASNKINDVIRGSSLGGNYALSVVPEPGSWLLLMLGSVVLNYRRRRPGSRMSGIL